MTVKPQARCPSRLEKTWVYDTGEEPDSIDREEAQKVAHETKGDMSGLAE
jgi:hypothetical protein